MVYEWALNAIDVVVRGKRPSTSSTTTFESQQNGSVGVCPSGLEKYANSSVESIGIEHRKRTTIAVELAAKPKLLLSFDEPTSGLDSQRACAIMSFLRSFADNGQAILFTDFLAVLGHVLP